MRNQCGVRKPSPPPLSSVSTIRKSLPLRLVEILTSDLLIISYVTQEKAC